MAQAEAGWYTDPGGRHGHRYWTGTEWTDHVADGGVTSVDGLPDAERNIPPAPETQHIMPTPPPVAVTQTNSSGGFGAVLGWIIAIIAVGALVAFLVFVAGNDDSTTTSLPSVTTAPVETTVPAETTVAP